MLCYGAYIVQKNNNIIFRVSHCCLLNTTIKTPLKPLYGFLIVLCCQPNKFYLKKNCRLWVIFFCDNWCLVLCSGIYRIYIWITKHSWRLQVNRKCMLFNYHTIVFIFDFWIRPCPLLLQITYRLRLFVFKYRFNIMHCVTGSLGEGPS